MEDGGITKAEIDTRAPFRSVKEAVMLFGESIVAGELHANNPKMTQDDEETAKLTSELEETKQSLQKAREESIQMAQCLSSLQQELERAKRELLHFKARHVLDLEIEEDLKFVEDSTDLIEQVKRETFASNRSMSVAQAFVPPPSEAVLKRHASVKKKKKKQLIPFIGGIFGKKKGSNENIGMA